MNRTMTTENENWQGTPSSTGNTDANREGNQTNKENGYTRVPYNREGNNRPHRPRFNPNAENAGRPQRAYSSDRPYRPRFNANGENGDRPQRTYGNDRPYSIVRVTMPIMPMAIVRRSRIVRDTTMLMAIVRSVLIIRIVPTVRDTTMPRMAVNVRNVRTITIARHTAMPTVPCVRVIIITTPTKAVSVRNARTEAIKDVPVSIPTITEETARITTISVAVRPDMIPMPSIARRSR